MVEEISKKFDRGRLPVFLYSAGKATLPLRRIRLVSGLILQCPGLHASPTNSDRLYVDLVRPALGNRSHYDSCDPNVVYGPGKLQPCCTTPARADGVHLAYHKETCVRLWCIFPALSLYIPLHYHNPLLRPPPTSSLLPPPSTLTFVGSRLPYLVCRELVAEHSLALVTPEVDQHLNWGHVELAFHSPRATPLRDSALGREEYTLLSNHMFVFRIECFRFKDLAG